jgi:TFIIB zinc-binding
MASRNVTFAPDLEETLGGGGASTGEGRPEGGGHIDHDNGDDNDDDNDDHRKPAARETPLPNDGDNQDPSAGGGISNRGRSGLPLGDNLFCPNCGSRDIEQPHDASGASICTSCGVVVEENAIVSAVEYVFLLLRQQV